MNGTRSMASHDVCDSETSFGAGQQKRDQSYDRANTMESPLPRSSTDPLAYARPGCHRQPGTLGPVRTHATIGALA
jgi:hypothetical protein